MHRGLSIHHSFLPLGFSAARPCPEFQLKSPAATEIQPYSHLKTHSAWRKDLKTPTNSSSLPHPFTQPFIRQSLCQESYPTPYLASGNYPGLRYFDFLPASSTLISFEPLTEQCQCTGAISRREFGARQQLRQQTFQSAVTSMDMVGRNPGSQVSSPDHSPTTRFLLENRQLSTHTHTCLGIGRDRHC